MADQNNRNEGEGNKTADKKYRDAASDYAQRTDTLDVAKQAEREREKNEPEFDQAERTGRSHSAGELRKDLTGEDFNKK